MDLLTDIKPISYLKSNSVELLNQVNETKRPVVITQNGEPRAVLQDFESYQNLRNTIGILKLIAQGEEDLIKGNTSSQESVFKKLGNHLQNC